MQIRTGKPADYSNLHIFGSPVYVMYNTQETTKLDPKSRRCLFLGYANGVKGYRLWDPTAHKVIISRDVIFMEDKKQVADDSTVDESSETAIVHMEKESVDDSFEVEPMHEIQEQVEQQVLEIRRSGRTTRPQGWQFKYIMRAMLHIVF